MMQSGIFLEDKVKEFCTRNNKDEGNNKLKKQLENELSKNKITNVTISIPNITNNNNQTIEEIAKNIAKLL
jgi:hypothetical protein